MQNWDGKSVFNWKSILEIQFNKLVCASDNHNNVCHICTKEL